MVPYGVHHVSQYHAWMEDEAIREATSSERLTLEEEYENQQSWQASHDKLTYILCQPLGRRPDGEITCRAGADGRERAVGDINLFLKAQDDDDVDGVVGEVDIMIADAAYRGKGLGRAALTTFLHHVLCNLDAIMGEYQQARSTSAETAMPELKMFMVKIKKDNEPSMALFRRLGFEQLGGVDYFGEVKMVLRIGELRDCVPEEYAELEYSPPLESPVLGR